MAAATIRPFDSLAGYEACVRLQREVWGSDFVDVVPPTMLMVAQRVGGISAGAFDAHGTLLGFVFGISVVRDGQLAHWSKMLAVRPEARGAGLGKRLKLYQRDLLVARGIHRAYWTYDPLVARNANLNLNGLGAMPVEYVTNMYGDTGSTLHAGLDTDRFIVEWRLEAAERSAAAPPQASAVGLAAAAADTPLPQDPWVRVAVPADIDRIKETASDDARRWQWALRRAFTWYLDRGYRVAGFSQAAEPDDSHYLLTRLPTDAEPACR